MKTYARIQDGLVAELLQTDDNIVTMFHPALIWVDVSSEPEVSYGWVYNGKNFTAPPAFPPVEPAPTIAELQAQIAALGAQLAVLSRHG